MGIKGLTTLLDHNNHILETHRLRDTRVVIDGNNLYHFLYNLYHIPVKYGGDYDLFSRAVCEFFSTLLRCEIRPVVVMDGPHLPNDYKTRTSIQRAKARIADIQDVLAGRGSHLTPILAQTVFIQALDSLGIDHGTCQVEADSQVAALANTLECPVLTNDSDFFIYDIKAGVILLDYVNLHLHDEKAAKPHIQVQLYRRSKFLTLFPRMDPDLMTVFGALRSTEQMPAGSLDPFYTTVKLPNEQAVKQSKVRCLCKQWKILQVLLWLEDIPDIDTAMEKILKSFKKDSRPVIQKNLWNVIDSYRKLPEPQMLPSLKARWDSLSAVSADDWEGLPGWLVSEHLASHLVPLVTNVARLDQVILLTQAESMSQPCSNIISRPLRQIMYRVLGKPCVQELHRQSKSQKRTKVEMKSELASGRQVPNIRDVFCMEDLDTLLCEALEVDRDAVKTWPDDLQLYLSTVVYCVNHAQLLFDWLHLAVVILCVVKLSGVDKICLGKSEDSDRDNLTSRISQSECPRSDIEAVQETLHKFHYHKNLSKSVEGAIIHKFAELQTCVMASTALNQVLRSPLTNIPVAAVFSGLFLYNAYMDICSQPEPEYYIKDVLLKGSPLVQIYQDLYSSVEKSCLPNALRLDLSKKKSKKTKVKKDKKKVSTVVASESSEEQSDGEIKNSVVIDVDVMNKFGCLDLNGH